MLGFPKNDGLRIDLILATEPLAARSTAASIDRDERKGEQPSDHAPVMTEFDWTPRPAAVEGTMEGDHAPST
jgi:exodeoxyribonuclease-3